MTQPVSDHVADYRSTAEPAAALPMGTAAPEFTLHTTPDQTVSLTDFRGQPVILAFYPADWSPVCGDEMALFNEILPEFRRYNAELLGISVDGVWCHLAFARDRKLRFPLLADFEPKGGVARRYGVYRRQVELPRIGGQCVTGRQVVFARISFRRLQARDSPATSA